MNIDLKDSIHIIESVSKTDILAKRCEGKALKEALLLAEMQVSYNQVKSNLEFTEVLLQLAEKFVQNNNSITQLPYVHISAHGNEYGIAFTDDSFLEWSDFEKVFRKVDDKIGHVKLRGGPSDPKSPRIVLCFSTCKGYNAYKIHSAAPCPFQAIIGPSESVSWPDSLLAFQVFYHAANYRHKCFDEAVLLMNTAAGLNNIFQIYKSPELR